MEVKKAAQLSLLGAQARRSALEMVYRATSGHLGGSMSLCEILSVLQHRTVIIGLAELLNLHQPHHLSTAASARRSSSRSASTDTATMASVHAKRSGV